MNNGGNYYSKEGSKIKKHLGALLRVPYGPGIQLQTSHHALVYN